MTVEIKSERCRLLSVGEVAEWLGVSSAWVRDHASGRRVPKLPAIKLGTEDGKGLWKFIPQDVENFIREQRYG
jgi:hypothetical protein